MMIDSIQLLCSSCLYLDKDYSVMIPTDYIEAIGCAVLAVNSWPLDKDWDLMEDLRREELFVPSKVAELSLKQVSQRLVASGYNRGNLTWMIAERLKNVMEAIADGQLDDIVDAVNREDVRTAREILLSLKGVGPVVADNSLLLIRS